MLKPILYALGGATAAVLVVATSALAGSGVGAVFNLGQSNSVNATSLLGGTVVGPMLDVRNQSTGNGATGVVGRMTSSSAGISSAGVEGLNSGAGNGRYGVYGQATGGRGTGVVGMHASSSGTTPGVEGDSSSSSDYAVGVLGRVASSGSAVDDAAVRGINTGTLGGTGVWGSSAGDGSGVVGTVDNEQPFGCPVSAVCGLASSAYGMFGLGSTGVLGQGRYTGVKGASDDGTGVWGSAPGGTGVAGQSYGGSGVDGASLTGIGVHGQSTDFQGVSGFSTNNAGVYGEGHFAGYFVGPTEQHGNLNTYDAQIRVAHGGGALSDTSAALQAEQEGTSGEAGWLRLSDSSNTNAVLMLIKQSSGTGDFLKCYGQSGPGSYSQKCHVDANGTFVSGSDFAESLPARGGRAGYEPGDVLSMSRSNPGAVVKSAHSRDRALIGVYSTRPAVLGADRGGVTRVGKNDVPVAITGIVPVKVSAQNGPIRPGDLLTSSSRPGRAMNAGRNPAIGTVLGKALGELDRGSGTIKMLVMLR